MPGQDNDVEQLLSWIEKEHQLDLLKEIRKNPHKKLFFFSVRVINAVANSFMGIPAARIIIAADNILSGTAIAFLSTPDKIFILHLASAILMTFLLVAYKSEASTSNRQEITLAITKLIDLTRILTLNTGVIKLAKEEAIFEMVLSTIRNGGDIQFSSDGGDDERKLQQICEENPNLQKLIQHEYALKQASKKNKNIYQNLYQALFVTKNEPNQPPELKEAYNFYKGIKDEPKRLIKLEDLLEKITVEKNYQPKFSTLGNVIGYANAVVNGILTCAFGIIGITAFIAMFAPGFALPLVAIIPIGITLFLAGTLHSGTITRAFIIQCFSELGLTIDKEILKHPTHTFFDWLQFTFNKIRDNRTPLLIAAFASVTITVLGVLATISLLGALPLPTPLVIILVTGVATLTWISAFNSFVPVLMKKIQDSKDEQYYKNNLTDLKERKCLNKARTVKIYHIVFSSSITVVALLISIPLMASQVGLLSPIMISCSLGIISYLATAVFNSDAIIKGNKPNEKSWQQIVSYRVRQIVTITLGLSFALAAGPTMAMALVNILPIAINAAIMPFLSITVGLLVAANLYYVISALYWDIALKPNPHHKLVESHQFKAKDNKETFPSCTGTPSLDQTNGLQDIGHSE